MPKKKKKFVSICEDEDVINPEDIDPSIGRFRNMIQTTVLIPNKVTILKLGYFKNGDLLWIQRGFKVFWRFLRSFYKMGF